jgi:hypothetical protein
MRNVATMNDATRFLQMISEQGGLATARQLLWSDTPSDGFTTLWEHHRLDSQWRIMSFAQSSLRYSTTRIAGRHLPG